MRCLFVVPDIFREPPAGNCAAAKFASGGNVASFVRDRQHTNMTHSLFDQLVARIREDATHGALPAFLQVASISPDMTLDELGMDSLGRMYLLTMLLELSDAPLSEEAFLPQRTLREIVEFVDTAMHVPR
ncbi:MAG: hypothetical protein GC151_08845 [Betaproteobacteria bacterium]|nr:hypothetical protein [Betaproteobacteria bacterium]